jgi:hypothetical protein
LITDKFQFRSKLKGDARLATLLRASAALLLMFACPTSAQSGDAGVMSSNSAGNSRNVTTDSSYVTIPPDSPPEEFYTIIYNQGTDSEGEAGWHDEIDGGEPVDDFKRTYQLNFEDVQRSFPMAFTLGIKGPNPPLPDPTFTVTGAGEKDTVNGNTSKPYTAFYMTDSITDSTEVLVEDDLKTAFVGSIPNTEFYRRWSLGPVSRAEPVAMTSSELIKIDDMEYALVVPLSAGGDYLSSVDPDTGKPVYNSSLRALYLHKPDRMKVTLSWEPASAVRVWHTPFKACTDGNHYFDGEIQNGQAFYAKDDENPIFVEIVESQNAKLRWGIDDLYHEIDLIPVDVIAHEPTALKEKTVTSGNDLQVGAEIHPSDEDSPENLKFVVNDDNDFLLAYNATYPKDLDSNDNRFREYEDDLVAVTFKFPKNIDVGTLEISANIDSLDPEARAYFLPHLYSRELVTLSPATSIDLSSATATDLLWELADEGEQTLYIEGLAAKDDLEVKLSFKVNGTEMASESVHMQILPSTERKLKVLAFSGMGGRAIVHMNNADNALRKDNDGYNDDKDRVTPISFRQDGAVISNGVPQSWQTVDLAVDDGKVDAIFERLSESPNQNIFICEYLYGVSGLARRGQQIMILGEPWTVGQSSGTPEGVLAHEWLHAFQDRPHVNSTDDIMWGDVPPPPEVDANNNDKLDGNESMVDSGHGSNVSGAQYNDFIN